MPTNERNQLYGRVGSDKVIKIVEQSGADVVAFENCTGYKQAFQVDGAIDLTWQACRTYNIEAFIVDEFVQEECL